MAPCRTGSRREAWVRGRTAIATLELVLALPVILVLLVAMVWLGYAVIGQAEVIAEARRSVWSQRFEPWTQTPFAFSQSQEAIGESTTTINVSPKLDGFGDPESIQTMQQANWDHRSVDFQPLPNWQLYVDIAIAAKREGLPSTEEDPRSAFEQPRSIGATTLADALRQITDELLNPSRSMESSGQSQSRRFELDRDLESANREGEIRELRREIDRLERAIEELKGGDAPDKDDQIWLEEQRLERLRIELNLKESDE